MEIDNNASERAIKNFVIGRKNWFMSNTSKVATSSATIYSLVETAMFSLKEYKIPVKSIHADTTSKNLYRQYKNVKMMIMMELK